MCCRVPGREVLGPSLEDRRETKEERCHQLLKKSTIFSTTGCGAFAVFRP
jgi:hypothetical protein